MKRKKKAGLSVANAKTAINAALGGIPGVAPADLKSYANLASGKLYELFVLSELLKVLKSRNWLPSFSSSPLRFKSPRGIVAGEACIELRRPGQHATFSIHVDIEVKTLGSIVGAGGAITDLSGYHEIDIVVVPVGTTGRPEHDELALGVECKGTANFNKSFVREVLGRRRELSILTEGQPCKLGDPESVPAHPASEYWLAFIDGQGTHYVESPARFGVILKHMPVP